MAGAGPRGEGCPAGADVADGAEAVRGADELSPRGEGCPAGADVAEGAEAVSGVRGDLIGTVVQIVASESKVREMSRQGTLAMASSGECPKEAIGVGLDSAVALSVPVHRKAFV
jgi:hypothetical protein